MVNQPQIFFLYKKNTVHFFIRIKVRKVRKEAIRRKKYSVNEIVYYFFKNCMVYGEKES